MKARSLFDIFGVGWDILLSGQRRKQRNIVYRQAYHSIRISTDRPLPIQGDGEVLGETPIELTIEVGAVKVIVPAEKAHTG
jgi:diacylglycerol kinase family enzyme